MLRFLFILFLLLNSFSIWADTFEPNLSKGKRTWIGEEFWANPLQDWQVTDNRIECLVSKKNRSIKFLTPEIDKEIDGVVETGVSFGALQFSPKLTKENFTVGLTVGVFGEFNNYKDAALKGNGFIIGINGLNNIVIGDSKIPFNIKPELLKDGIDLNVIFKPIEEGFYDVSVSLLNATSRQLIKKVNAQIHNIQLYGSAGLIADFPDRNNTSHKNERVPSFWFKDIKLKGEKVKNYPERSYGPLLFSMYCIDKQQLKITTQLAPLNFDNTAKVALQLRRKGGWETVQTKKVSKETFTVNFVEHNWNTNKNHQYRIRFKDKENEKVYFLKGEIKNEPPLQENLNLAALSCIRDYAFPHEEIVDNIKAYNPDLIFFAGDQFYEFDGGFGVADDTTPFKIARLDYMRKWYVFGWAFKDLLLNYPSILLMDDHDVFQGNLWGWGGKPAANEDDKSKREKGGGYLMPYRWLKMAQATQTAHLPSPYLKQKDENGWSTYFTELEYSGVSFALLEDRRYKSPPKMLKNLNLNAKDPFALDIKGAELLGKQQLKFLNEWATNWDKTTLMKVVLSQTVFSTATTNPKSTWYKKAPEKGVYPEHTFFRDTDTNGWPQKGRNKALTIMKKAGAFHICGDQHVGVTGQYGINDWKDGGYFTASPAVSNAYPRGWFPPERGKNQTDGMNTTQGDFNDAFGNKLTIYGVFNPQKTELKPARLYDFAPGFTTVSINKVNREFEVNVWARNADLTNENEKPVNGYPIVVSQFDNYGTASKYQLPTFKVKNWDESKVQPLLTIIDQQTNEMVYTFRLATETFKPKVDKLGSYTVLITFTNDDEKQIFKNIKSEKGNTAVINVE